MAGHAGAVTATGQENEMTSVEDATGAEPATDLRSLRTLTWILAAACGLAVANLYYSQPLLAEIGRSFHVGQDSASIVVTATQLGYALGLVFVLPMGDLLENRKLTSRTLVVTTVALVALGLAPNFSLFLALSVLVGITSVVAQILIPLAAHLAPEAERGQFVGRVMSGLLLGILLARTVSSLVAAVLGWRSIFFISAGLILAMAWLLSRTLPVRKPSHQASYRQLLASLGELIRTEPTLRRRAICQALMFSTFSAFWTVISFQLIDAHGLSQTGIGLFALVGAAGALAAPVAGRLADAGYNRISSGLALLLGSVSMVVAGLAKSSSTLSLVLLAVAAVLLDLAVQGHQVLSQQEIYQLRADARARINTVYMGTVFFGGAVAGWLHSAHGWESVCIFGGVLPLIAFAVWATGPVPAKQTTTV
jgi:predicted MFS family arabinose efflux permease